MKKILLENSKGEGIACTNITNEVNLNWCIVYKSLIYIFF